MKKFFYIVPLLVATLLVGCEEKWDAHYEQTGTVSDLDLLAYLESQPQYSEFVAKLAEYGLAEELQRDQNLTVWAVSNDQMAALQGMAADEEEVKSILSFHINSLVFDNTKLKDGLRVMAFNGKYITITKDGDVVHVGDATIVKGNQLCKNGVVHEISQLLKPDISIYDYLSGLGEDYSIIRDSVLAMNDTIFDLENSIPIGVDPTGNTLYDSVYVISNPVFDKANIRSEFSNVTMFLPSNDVVNACFEDLGTLYTQFGKEFLPEDSLVAYTWIKEAIFYDHVVEDFNAGDLISAFDRVWKPEVQLVNTDYTRMSNGRVYEVTKMKIPNNVHIRMIKQLFYYWQFVPEAERDELFTLTNVSDIAVKDNGGYEFPSIGVEGTYYTLNFSGADPNDGLDAKLDFTPVSLEREEDGSMGYKVVEVPPGEYNLYMGFRSKSHPFVNIYFDGQLIAEQLNVDPSNPWNFDRVTNTVPGTKYDGWGGLVGPVTVAGEGVRSFKITVEFAGTNKGTNESLEPYHWALVPTENNY